MFYSYVKENVFAAVEIRYERGRGWYHFSMKSLRKGTFAVKGKGVGYLSGSSHCKDLLSALPFPSLVTTIHCTLHNYEFITLLHAPVCMPFFRQFHGTSKLTFLYATLNHYCFTFYNRRHIVRKKQEKKTFCKMFFFQKK